MPEGTGEQLSPIQYQSENPELPDYKPPVLYQSTNPNAPNFRPHVKQITDHDLESTNDSRNALLRLSEETKTEFEARESHSDEFSDDDFANFVGFMHGTISPLVKPHVASLTYSRVAHLGGKMVEKEGKKYTTSTEYDMEKDELTVDRSVKDSDAPRDQQGEDSSYTVPRDPEKLAEFLKGLPEDVRENLGKQMNAEAGIKNKVVASVRRNFPQDYKAPAFL